MKIKKSQKNNANYNINLYTKIEKVDEELRMVYGYCTTEALDSQGEVVSKEAIRKAWQAYMEYGNIREMHQPSAVGVTKEYSHDDTGTWIGVKVVDSEAWEKVKEGVYKGFSIGGRVTLKVDNVIKGIILSEISLVDRPACPDAKISVIKIDDGLVESLTLEEINNNKIMKKFVTIDGVKYVEDPDKAGEALLGTDGEKVLFVDEDATETTEETEVVETEEEVEETETVETTEEIPAGESAGDAPIDAGEKGAKAVVTKKEDVKKDSEGVLTMASLLDHLEWAISCFASEGKDTANLLTVKSAIMEVIKAEAETADKGVGQGDMNKMAKAFSEEVLGKVGDMLKAQLGGIVEKVDNLAKEVDVIKGTKVSKRPTTAHAVEKEFANGEDGIVNKSSQSIDEANVALKAVEKEIDDHSTNMGQVLAVEPHRQTEMLNKSNELSQKLFRAKEAVKDAMGRN